jgi:SAM-dependent methyltransferase
MPKDNANEYDRIYAKNSYDVSSVYDHIIRIRQRYFADLEGKALDHGFGNGVISEYLKREGFETYGVESSAQARTVIEDRAAVTGLNPENFQVIGHGDSTLPFDNDMFSLIVSNQVLYFIQDREQIDRTVSEFSRVLRSGGKVACTVMAEDNYYFTEHGIPPIPEQGLTEVRIRGRIDRDFSLYRFRDEADLASSFEKAGLIIDDLGYFDFKMLDVSLAKHYIVLARKP